MDDKHPEAIVVHLGGKDRRIKLGPAAFRYAESKHGVTVSINDLAAPSAALLASLVWIGLLPDDQELKEDTALAWLAAADDEAEITGRVYKAVGGMMEGFTKAFGDSGNAPQPRRRK